MAVAETVSRRRSRCLDDDEIAELARSLGTPLYVYDLVRLRQRIGALRRALDGANATLFFATMANDRVPLLKLMAELRLGACVNSVPHLALASDCGFADSRSQFTSTGVSDDDMRLLQARGIRCNLDSIPQLETWCGLGASEAGIRVNASSIGRGLPRDRIGIEASQVQTAEAVATKRGATLSGLHIYVGTNFQQPGEMLPTLEGFFDLAATVKSLAYVNIGGGIGVNYRHDGSEFDIFEFGHGIRVLSERLRRRLGRDVEVIVEPGRGLAASCGTFVTAVTDIKDLGERTYATVDASIAIFPRPFHHPESPHRIRKLGAETSAACEDGQLLIVGRTTFSRDILGSMPKAPLETGDLLAFDDAGAYSQSMASRFLGQREPEMAFIDE
jgi:diaminopimelate decarboxylase